MRRSISLFRVSVLLSAAATTLTEVPQLLSQGKLSPAPSIAGIPVTLTTKQSDILRYTVGWENTAAALGLGDSETAAKNLAESRSLQSSLAMSISSDLAVVEAKRGAVCWQLGLPECAYFEFSQVSATDGAPANLRSVVAPYLSQLQSLIFQRDQAALASLHVQSGRPVTQHNKSALGQAQCRAASEVAVATPSQKFGAEFLYAELLSARGDDLNACNQWDTADSSATTPAEHNAVRIEYSKHACDKLGPGKAIPPGVMLGIALDETALKPVVCTPIHSGFLPPKILVTGPVDISLYAGAIAAKSVSDSYANLTVLEGQLRSMTASEQSLDLTNAVEAFQYADAEIAALRRDWKTALDDYNAILPPRTLFSLPENLSGPSLAVRQTQMALHILLWNDRFQAGYAALGKSIWTDALADFQDADYYLRLPINHVGMGLAEANMVTSCPGPTFGGPVMGPAKNDLNIFLQSTPPPDPQNAQAVRNALNQIDAWLAKCNQTTDQELLAAVAAIYLRSVHEILSGMEQPSWSAYIYLMDGGSLTIEWGGDPSGGFGGNNDPPEVQASSPAPIGDGQTVVTNVEPGIAISHQGLGPGLVLQSTTTPVPPVDVMPPLPELRPLVPLPTTVLTPDQMKAALNEQAATAQSMGVKVSDIQVGKSVDASSLRAGDLVATSGDSSRSAFVRLSQGSLAGVSHVMMYVGDGYVVEAVGTGVRLIPLGEALQGDNYAAIYRNTQLPRPQGAVDFAIQQLGKPYNLAGLVTHPRFGLLTLPGGLNISNGYFCSQLTNEAMRAGGAPSFISAEGSGPDDIPNLGFLEGIKYIGTLLNGPAPAPSPTGTPAPEEIPLTVQ